MTTTGTPSEEESNALKRTLHETGIKQDPDEEEHDDEDEDDDEDSSLLNTVPESVDNNTNVAAPSQTSKQGHIPKRTKTSNKGRHGDPRMHRAVAARLLNPELSLLEALIEGGFAFPEGTEGSGKSDRNIYDTDGVLLCQRKNQLSRRLRLAKKRQQASRSEGHMFSTGIPGQSQGGDTRTLQNMLLSGQLPMAGNEIPMIPPHHFIPPFFPPQAAAQLDPSMLNGGDSRGKMQGMDGNLDQYFQQARAMGLRPEQFSQSLHNYQNQAMFPGFPGAGMPFQPYPGMPNQGGFMPTPPMDQQQQQHNSGGSSNNGGGNPSPPMQMPPNMMAMQQQQQQQQQYNNDLNRMLFNRSLFMNVMGQQLQQQQQQHQEVSSTQNQEGGLDSTPEDADPSSGTIIKQDEANVSSEIQNQEEEDSGIPSPTSFREVISTTEENNGEIADN